ncbi:MAG: SDR family NAD(P)-dependent oxidoreductase [Collinsella sp.]|nr:SDR family NAD(P)-dependent oxidoreductase [Collinsella sp.]
MSNWLKLEGDVCAVTGALGGMGTEICREFARNGANVVMLDLDEEKVKAAAADLAAEFGIHAEGYKMNATDEAEVQSAVDATIADFGRVDVLVNTAGILRFAATADTLLMGKVASIAAVQLFADPTSAAAVALGGVVVSVNTCANLVGRLSFGQIIDKLGA